MVLVVSLVATLAAFLAVVAAARIGTAVEAATASPSLVPVPAEVVAVDRLFGVDLEVVRVDVPGYATRELEVLSPESGPASVGEVVLVRASDQPEDRLDFVAAPFAVDRDPRTSVERLDRLGSRAAGLHYGGLLAMVLGVLALIGSMDEVLRRGWGRWRRGS